MVIPKRWWGKFRLEGGDFRIILVRKQKMLSAI